MVRWKPAAHERLQAAALDLFANHGFEETTVAEIALAVGLTERTFYRYFSDKREVIFAGQEQFVEIFLRGIADAASDATPLQVVTGAVLGAGQFFPEDRRSFSRQRHIVISSTPELQERELLKMAALAGAIAAALVARGVAEPAATLAAESGVTVFRISFGQWIAEGAESSLAQIEKEVFRELGALSASAL